MSVAGRLARLFAPRASGRRFGRSTTSPISTEPGRPPTGQSGHLGSPHYDDFIGPWRRGELVPLVLSRARVEELAESRLVLAPSPE
jgi:acyl-homoserine lactone acylase PvdQ